MLAQKLFKGVAAGIGLASESIHHRKEKKAAKERGEESGTSTPEQQPEDLPSELYGDQRMSQQIDEASWQLDEAQDEVTHEQPQPVIDSDTELSRLADDFSRNHPLPEAVDLTVARLELPVILIQKRPRKRVRGFIRAYSPLLMDVGIDQSTFLDFVDNLNKAIIPSGWIQAINLASLAVQHVPEPVSIAVGIAIQAATNVGSEMHSRSKTNKFLDQVNESFFAPRGLVALMMTWKPSKTDELMTSVNMDAPSIEVPQSNQAESGSLQKMKEKFKKSNAKSDFQWPECAPLVFPVLDNLVDEETGEVKEEKQKPAIKRAGLFVQEYMDKRAQAEWQGQNPDSNIANLAPKPEFHSRYSDPNHPAASGDPIALLTGGRFQSGGGIGGRLAGERGGQGGRGGLLGGGLGRGLGGGLGGGRGLGGRLGGRSGLLGGRSDDGMDQQGSSSRPGITGIGGLGRSFVASKMGGSANEPPTKSLIKGVKKLFQDDVLYLLIVQRPTEEQIAESVAFYQSFQQAGN